MKRRSRWPASPRRTASAHGGVRLLPRQLLFPSLARKSRRLSNKIKTTPIEACGAVAGSEHRAELGCAFSLAKRLSWERRGAEGRGEGVGRSAGSPATKRILGVEIFVQNHAGIRKLSPRASITDYTYACTLINLPSECKRTRTHTHIPGDGKASTLTGVSCPPYRLHPNPGSQYKLRRSNARQ